MPTVPRPQRQIETRALPGARLSAAETDLSTGAGVEEARGRKWSTIGRSLGGAIGQTAGVLGEIATQERDKADQVALLGASNQLSMWENKRLYEPTTGALSLKGKDAQGLPETIAGEYTEVADTIESGLTTARQKAAFQRYRLNKQGEIDLTIRRHVFGEMKAYDSQETQSAVDNAINAAIINANDPRRVGVELGNALEVARGYAKRNGVGPEALEGQLDAITTKAHVGVIEQLLSQDKTAAANVYFEETKSQINGEQQARIEKALQVGTAKKAGQVKADEILGAGGTLTEQREKARAIEDPDVRDNVMARLEHESAIQDKTQRDLEEANLNRAYQIVDSSKSVDGIPADLRAQLAEHMPALRSYALSRARGVPVETDPKTFYSLMDKVAYDPEGFSTTNLLAYRNKLDEGDWKQLVGLQLSARKGDKAAVDHELAGFRTKNDIFDETIQQYGIDPKTKDKAVLNSLAQLRSMIDLRVNAAQQPDANGKRTPVNNVELKRTIEGVISQTVHKDGTFSDLFWGGVPAWRNGTNTRLIDMQPEDVPADQKASLERALRAKQRPVTPQTVLDLYLELQVK